MNDREDRSANAQGVSREDADAWRKPLCGFAERPRGIRNRNPLNIRAAADNRWRGEVGDNPDRGFERFEDAVFGLRAAVRLIRVHHRRGANTIRRLATVWAPPGENPHLDSYIRVVARHAAIDADTVLDFSRDAHLRPVLLGMIHAENGIQPYSDMTIDTALALAGANAEGVSPAEPRTPGANADGVSPAEPRTPGANADGVSPVTLTREKGDPPCPTRRDRTPLTAPRDA